ncbi:glycoside hydrolase family 16 protein [Altererythrobacter sp. BO-6]|uniref:glycoside hydrolase family 16 protein n=1 Tax=Altererythrobacter sp. BO-6 TaxID=2604537 RepID=UPI0019D2B048|nr:glycoside hydrolase family 16 protein [Altererythrobacter sp. BO-6]
MMHKTANLAAAVIGFLVASPAQLQYDQGEELDLCQYSLFWSDEFDDLSIGDWLLNGKRWIAHTPWAGDFGDAQFTDPGPDGPFSIEDGKLVITARRNRDGKWTSGLISAADQAAAGVAMQYGYFEARMRVTPGPGTWAAFWLYNRASRNDPRTGFEIDAIEYYGHDPASYFATWHINPTELSGDKKSGGTMQIPIEEGTMTRNFHMIGVDVTPEIVTYFFDRKPVWRHPTPKEHDAPLFPLVNLALGSGYSIENTPNPSQLEVDYVRLYEPLRRGEETQCGAGESQGAVGQ